MTKRASRPESPRAELVEQAYLHILARDHNTHTLAKALGSSIATTARAVDELRAKLAGDGGELVSVRTVEGWHFEIRQKIDWKNDPLLKAVGSVKRVKSRWAKPEDESIYGRD